MGVPFCHHSGLCVAGVALDSFNVTAAQFEFVGCAGVTEAVKNYSRQIVVFDKFAESPIDKVRFSWGALGAGKNKIIIPILISQQFLLLGIKV